MESAAAAAANNIHNNHKSQIVCSSNSLPLHNNHFLPAGGGNSPHHLWTPNSILSNNVSFASSASDSDMLNLRNPRFQNHDNNNMLVASLLNPCMSNNKKEVFGLDQWDGIHHQGHHDEDDELELSEIKQESLYPTTTCYNSNYAKELREVDEFNVKLLLKSMSCGGGVESNGIQSSLEDQCSSVTSRKQHQSSSSSCSQIYPTINVSDLLGSHNHVSAASGSFGLNFQPLDLFNNNNNDSGRFGASFRPPQQQQQFQEHVGFVKNSAACFPYGLDFMQQSVECTLDSSGNVELHNKRLFEESKKHEEPKASSRTQVGSKRSRSGSDQSRACPPFKVRKEKLGDRIAALQQLVAPFGKTDTASVLMEAIGYIKFLQSQVETLSVPYLKSSRHKNNRPAIPHGGYVDNRREEQKQDLRSRGLCLVPVSCLSYVTDVGGVMWPPPHFG